MKMIKKILSIIVVLTLIAGSVTSVNTVRANSDTSRASSSTSSVSENNLVLDKKAELNNDGTATIKLSAYAKGKTVSVQKPADIVLVLDQSGSMAYRLGNERRITALKEAVNTFLDNIKRDADEKKIDHRVSIVGFAEGIVKDFFDNINPQESYLNTALLSTTSGAIRYDRISATDYRNSLKSVRDTSGYNILKRAVANLRASGPTRIDLGEDMAKKVFQNRSKANEVRNKIVVTFTDGLPTDGNIFNFDVANTAISTAKFNTRNYSVKNYTVGIFAGATPSDMGGSINSLWTDNQLGNRFLNILSDNYPNKVDMGLGATWSYWNRAWQINSIENLIPSSDQFYKTARDKEGLKNIFYEIFTEIQGEKPIVTVLDGVQPQLSFPLNQNGDINRDSLIAKVGNRDIRDLVTINKETNSLSVSEVELEPADENNPEDISNKKLYIEFKVNRAEDFLGGNGVQTNTSDSGITIKVEGGEDITVAFPQPKVDLALVGQVYGVGGEKSIYQGDSLGYNSVQSFFENTSSGLPFKIGNNIYNTNGKNNAYVDITYTIYDDKNKELGKYVVPSGSIKGAWSSNQVLDKLVIDKTKIFKIITKISSINEGTQGNVITSNAVQFKVNIFNPTIQTENIGVYIPNNPALDTSIKSVDWVCKDNTNAKQPKYAPPKLTYDYAYANPEIVVNDKMTSFPKEDTLVKIKGVWRTADKGPQDLNAKFYLLGGEGNASYAEVKPSVNVEGKTFKVSVIKPLIKFNDKTIKINQEYNLQDSLNTVIWKGVVSGAEKPTLKYKFYTASEQSQEKVKSSIRTDIPVNVKVFAEIDGEDVEFTDYVEFSRRFIEKNGGITQYHYGEDDEPEFIVFVRPDLIKINLTKEVSDNTNQYEFDDFHIKVSAGFFETDLIIGNNETKTFYVEEGSDILIEEVNPMEFTTLNIDKKEISPKEYTYIVKSKFMHKGYFRSFVNMLEVFANPKSY